MQKAFRCPHYYQNINQEGKTLGDPMRCRQDRYHEGRHSAYTRGLGWTTWPSEASMIHPMQKGVRQDDL